jgi:lysophospholipase L1-like esterase
MKALYWIAGAAAVAFISGVIVGHYHLPPFEQLREFKRHLTFIGAIGLTAMRTRNREEPADIVMLGDSITEGGNWAASFPAANIANLGVDGDTSAGILNRLDDVVRRKPRLMFVMIGVNDLIRDMPADLVAANIERVATQLAKNGGKPVLQSTLFVQRGFKAGLNEQIVLLNEQVQAWCGKNGFTFIDLNAVLSSGQALRAGLSDDGLHLNARGYALWSDAIRPQVESAAR